MNLFKTFYVFFIKYFVTLSNSVKASSSIAVPFWKIPTLFEKCDLTFINRHNTYKVGDIELDFFHGIRLNNLNSPFVLLAPFFTRRETINISNFANKTSSSIQVLKSQRKLIKILNVDVTTHTQSYALIETTFKNLPGFSILLIPSLRGNIMNPFLSKYLHYPETKKLLIFNRDDNYVYINCITCSISKHILDRPYIGMGEQQQRTRYDGDEFES